VPSYVKYSSSGANPSYYSSSILAYLNVTNADGTVTSTDITGNIKSFNDSLIAVKKSEVVDENKKVIGYEYYIKPSSKFYYEDSTVGTLKC
jgi:hypothetical protein